MLQRVLPFLATALAFGTLPLWIKAVGLYPYLGVEVMIWTLYALGFNLLLGTAGLPSFGHGAYFGVGAYAMGLAQFKLAASLWGGLLAATLAAALVGGAVALFISHRRGIYFALMTIAFGQMFFFIAYQWTTVTGGEDGMPGIPRPALLGIDFSEPLAYYAFVGALFLLALGVMKRIVESPLGKILQAIRENEVRAQAVGYDTARFKLLAFVIGGAFSGLAGVLYAMLFGIVPLEAIGFVFSGNVVFATLIGGTGSLYGPVIGAVVFIWLSESVSVVWARWPLLLGVAFVIVVLFFRGGVVEAWARFWAWRARRASDGVAVDVPR